MPETTERARLADRRSLVVGDRLFVQGDASGAYPASGFHTRGEMGGFWAPPVKLLDGLWFGVDGSWLAGGSATEYASGAGYERFRYQAPGGVTAERVQFVPDGLQSAVIGVTLRAPRSRTVTLAVDAHSDLMPAYPWTGTTPTSTERDLPDSVSGDRTGLTFREQSADHDYAAVVSGTRAPSGVRAGGTHRGPQDPPVLCPATGDAPYRCDDSAGGKGAGGGLEYRVELSANRPTTLWFAVSGSEQGLAAARSQQRAALADPAGAFAAKLDARRAVAARTRVDLPGDRLLQSSVEWSKQNLADSVQEARDLRVREVNAGTAYPAPVGTVARARWIGAGFPDYPWLFATDGEYSAHAAVAAGDFDSVRAHLRALRDVSDLVNRRSGKVVHEVVSTGDVYFGTNADPGNTDETAKFPSTVALLWRWTGDDSVRDEFYDAAVRALRYVDRTLDTDGDGWPEGLGNVERAGMGEEKLDNTVYYIRGLRDLADLATSKADREVARWATTKADDLQSRFEAQWWNGAGTNAYADSIDLPDAGGNDNTRIFQRHWTGVTPMEADLPTGPLAQRDHALAALTQREKPCYTGEFGLYHTGSGPTTTGNPGPSCDNAVSQVPSERSTFSLNTAIMAVAEGNYGRLSQQRAYTTGNARIQLDNRVWEKPGAMPEIAPSPDFTANIDRPFTDRSMVLQAWGTYGVLWPVVHQQLGIDPDLGRRTLSVVPQIPAGQTRVAGENILLGKGSASVSAELTGQVLRVRASVERVRADVVVGAVLPEGKRVAAVTVGGKPVPYRVVTTSRGTEVRAAVGPRADLSIRLAG
ncbi:glycogen debranching protein [Actinokineospora bangkokensis]|uniref:Glycogen debranching protein n=1 Tax=Actinokineospora bangkokensis TaxID=1193682 RepID=A0A1Q9LLE4_9PSEU|nr:glycogen debranching protein [Actinokineospora bangkokensis]